MTRYPHCEHCNAWCNPDHLHRHPCEVPDCPGGVMQSASEALWLESDLSDRRCASHDALDQFAREYQGLTR